MTYEDGLRRLESRTKVASALTWGVIGTGTLMAGGELLEAAGMADTINGTASLDLMVSLVYVLFFLTLLASVVAVGMWIHRAHANLHEAGVDGLEFTPGWAVGWYFIPFANLVKPFQAMRELWTASHAQLNSFAGDAPGEVKTWWGCWIVGNILSNISARFIDGSESGMLVGNLIGAAGTAGLVGAALMLLRIMREVCEAQRGTTSATVFA